MIHKAWCSIEEVPYYFSRSYIKFQGHTGWKIDDLDQIWARLLGRSQLSNPPDLPCFYSFDQKGIRLDYIFPDIVMKENVVDLIQTSMMFVLVGQTDDKSVLVMIMLWCQMDDKP